MIQVLNSFRLILTFIFTSLFLLSGNTVFSQQKPNFNIPENIIHKINKATSPQPAYTGGHTIKQAIDGSLESANWHCPGSKDVTGEFFLEKPSTIDYIVFHGASFKKVHITAHLGSSTKNLGTFDLGSSGLIRLKMPLKQVSSVSIEVNDSPGFTLREIEFVQKAENKLTQQLLKVFKDSSCSSLKKSFTASDLASLPVLFQTIAKKLNDKSYEGKEFRIGRYKAYSYPEFPAKVRKIKPMNPFDNPTGILAEDGEEIIVLVGKTYGHDIALASVKPGSIESTTYPLDEGINKIKITRSGLLYVMYHADISKPQKAISVHIPEGYGKVNGYFDITRHNDNDWKQLLAKAPGDYIDVVGRQIMLMMPTKYLREFSPNQITNTLQVWDESILAMWKIMGFYKYPQPHNNRQLGVLGEFGVHMFSTDYYCGYSLGNNGVTMKNEEIAPGILQGNRLWGIGHENGHSYQECINWRSMTESSNNFFAQLILDQVANKINGNEKATDMENPCKYLLRDAVKGKPFHDFDGWSKWGFAQYSFYLYFHKLGINPNFYPNLYESLRHKPLSKDSVEISTAHLAWYERICDISKTDFTEDFEIFNWFVPMDMEGNQYGKYTCKLTKEMGDASKARIAAKHYPKPKFRIAFMHQHGKTVNLWGKTLSGPELNGYWKKYLANGKLDPQVSATKTGNRINIAKGENAAAFCVKTQGKIVGYYDRTQFDVNDIAWDSSSEIYAIPMQTAEPYKLIYPKKDSTPSRN